MVVVVVASFVEPTKDGLLGRRRLSSDHLTRRRKRRRERCKNNEHRLISINNKEEF